MGGETKEEIEEEIKREIMRNGPMSFSEIKENIDSYNNNILFTLIHTDIVVKDTSGRYHLRNNDKMSEG